ncbi:MAG: hypothetical protein H8E40_11425 [Chloroflexi bacterium]|nr:hypothetical protein [Chloroflexota bacterium]MBL7061242.1 hypothetical protein [Dehalococcoidia bacterium]
MLRSQVGRILFGLLTSILIITQAFPFDIQSVEALGPYEVATGTDKFSTAWESQRKLAIESDGTIHAVYYRTDGSLICQIYHAYSSDDGITWTEEQVTSASRDQVYTALAVDSQDNLHIVWQDGDEGKMGSGGNPVTYYRCKNKQVGWQAAEFISSYATYPAIAVDSNDDVHVVYGTFVYPPGFWGGGNGIRWKKKTTSGWQTEESISSNKQWTRWPAIAIDGSDNIHVAWLNDPRAYEDINYRKRTASGWETEVQVNTELDNVRGKPSIIVDSNDYVHIVWLRETGVMFSIRYRTYTTSWQPPVDVEGPTTYNQGPPVISIDNLGHIHVVWTGQHSESPTIDQIRHREYTDSWQPIQNLTSSTSDDQDYPSLLWARYPVISGVQTNQPEDGYAFIWQDGTTTRYYNPIYYGPDTTPPAVTLTYPNGGESWLTCSAQNITWNAVDNLPGTLNYLIEYSIDDGSTFTTIASLTGQSQGASSYAWTVPDVNSAYCRIKTTATDGTGNSTSATSGAFTISGPASAPDWRQGIQPGDILYDEGSIFIPVILPPIPPTIISIGHTGMYVRSGITIEADSSGVLYRDISSWDKPQRKNVYLLRVNCSQEAINNAINFAVAQLNKEYDYKWVQKKCSPESNHWYCSELVWAAYYNQGAGINTEYNWSNSEVPEGFALPGCVFDQPVHPVEIYRDVDTLEIGRHEETEVPWGVFVIVICPVDLVVTDPQGLSISKNSSQIVGAIYMQDDFNNDGSPDDLIYIPQAKTGMYLIQVIPEPGANPNDTFSLEVSINGQSIILAENVQVKDIPSEPYRVQVTESGTVSVFAGSPPASPPPTSPGASPTPPRPLNPAQMSLQYLSVTPQQTGIGQPVTITTNMSNTGDEAGNYNVALKINGQLEQQKMVSVGPQGTQPVKFTVAKSQPGTYTVDIAGQKGSFTVLGSSSSTADTHAGVGLIVILLLGILVLASVVVVLVTFRRPA